MAKHTSKIDRQLTTWVNSLTPAQMTKLYDVIQPLDPNDPINEMTDDELLAALVED